jgi:hypothetical protein
MTDDGFPPIRGNAATSWRRGARAALIAAPLAAGLAALLCGAASAAASPEPPLPYGHAFVCTDYTKGWVCLVSEGGAIEWRYPAPSCNDVWILPGGNLLFNTGHGVKEVTRGKDVVFDYESKSSIYACQRLPDGSTFIGECNSGRLLEVRRDGSIAKEVRLLPPGADGGGAFMRNARRLPNGNYLVAHYGLDVVREYDPAGRLVREIPAPGGPHTAIRLPGGDTLISCADHPNGLPRVFEVDPEGKTVWSVDSRDLPGISLKFVAGFQRLPNGNTVMANWLGHGHFGEAPQIIEVTPQQRVVWTYANHAAFGTVSNLQLVDVPGDATRGEVWR